MSLCEKCVQGVQHEGTSEGSIESINGVETYVALPQGDYPKDKALLLLTDAFGIPLNNNKLLADSFARNGIPTYVPDLFNGDALPADALSKVDPRELLTTWVPKHQADSVRPAVDEVVGELKKRGVKKYAASGYCFGARYVMDLILSPSGDFQPSVGINTHPSGIKVPEDFEALVAKQPAFPTLWNTCEQDTQFPPTSTEKAKEILGDGKYKAGFELNYYAGVHHGFAVRGDLSDPTVKSAKEDSFIKTVEFIGKYLK